MNAPLRGHWGLNSRTGLLAILTLLTTTLSYAQPGNYYQNVDTTSASALRSDLHNLIDDHLKIPYTSSSTDTWDVLKIADEDQDNAGRITALYKNVSYAKQVGGNSLYNREHSWPKSYGFPNDGSGNYPYTDMHHLFLSDITYNAERSNKPFGNCHSGCEVFPTEANDGRGGSSNAFPGDSNWTTGDFTDGVWQPWSGRRGDVARALLYMDVRYEGGSHGVTGASEPDLILTDDLSLIAGSQTGSNASVAYMGLESVLLQWHAADPVDAIEMQHHEAVASFQGNRNPFIDHPEWVACVFENTCDGSSPGGSDLANGETRSGLSGAQGSWQYFTITLPEGASDLAVQISGGSGDADLYLRRGAQPTTSQYDCRPYIGGNNESCSAQTDGTYHIGIRAWSAYGGLTLSVSYHEGGGSSGPVTLLSRNNVSGSSGQWRNYPIEVAAGTATLTVQIAGGSGDADLYVRRGALPTTTTYDCRPWLNGNNETCTFSNPGSGSWTVSVRGYSAYSGLSISASSE